VVMAPSPYCFPLRRDPPARSHNRVPMGRESNTGHRSDICTRSEICAQRASMIPRVPSQDPCLRLLAFSDARETLLTAAKCALMLAFGPTGRGWGKQQFCDAHHTLKADDCGSFPVRVRWRSPAMKRRREQAVCAIHVGPTGQDMEGQCLFFP
jgi:hypothetical protein